MTRRRGARILMFVPLAVLFVALLGWVVMTLWNWLAPVIFGWKVIGYWQALGLMLLGRLLFGSCHGPGRWHGRWRHRMMERWERMTPEERERFRQGLHDRWCHFPREPKPAE